MSTQTTKEASPVVLDEGMRARNTLQELAFELWRECEQRKGGRSMDYSKGEAYTDFVFRFVHGLWEKGVVTVDSPIPETPAQRSSELANRFYPDNQMLVILDGMEGVFKDTRRWGSRRPFKGLQITQGVVETVKQKMFPETVTQ